MHGGRGAGKVTNDKCTHLQNYYRGAILNNFGNQEAMNHASLFHCCPDGIGSWCFFKAAIAEGKPPPPHADHCGTAISRNVFQVIVPIYKRMSSPVLLRKIAQGKTQNTNESLNNLIWIHCPKETFVGKDRLTAAVAEAVAKFNRGNSHIAEVLELMNIPANASALSALEREREMFYLTTHSTYFIYGYMASDIWLRTILIVRKETRCRHIGYYYRLTARVLLYAPSHRQDNTYHGLCYTSRGALAGTRNSSMGPPHEGSIRRPTAP